MIDELLDLARIEVGKMVIHLEAVEPALVVAEAVGIVQPMVAARELHLIQHDVAVGLAVRADRLRLRQVLVNLLANAVKYNRAGGEITVRCERRGEQVRISVGDTGPGIAPEHLDRLFLPFERLGAEGGGVEGTGIGLALSKQLAELMGGALGVDTNVGVGSVFWVDLPLAKAGRA
ncbi:MAG: HAMP domain-containing histidine kinase [Rhizobacter sp.]|nr:HAMP domain-containing histidine kinase [Rhizobacter sp.]